MRHWEIDFCSTTGLCLIVAYSHIEDIELIGVYYNIADAQRDYPWALYFGDYK